MKCPKCDESNILINIDKQYIEINKKHSILWWLFIGIWWRLVKYTILLPLVPIKRLFLGAKKDIIEKQTKTKICQNCGHTW